MKMYMSIYWTGGLFGFLPLMAQQTSLQFPNLKYIQPSEFGVFSLDDGKKKPDLVEVSIERSEFIFSSDLDLSREAPVQASTMLPLITVHDKQPNLSERDLLTDRGRLAIAKTKFLSPLYREVGGPLSQLAGYYFLPLSILNGWHPNDAEAMVLYRQQERLDMLSEMNNLIRLDAIGKPEADRDLRRVHAQQYISSRMRFFTPSKSHP